MVSPPSSNPRCETPSADTSSTGTRASSRSCRTSSFPSQRGTAYTCGRTRRASIWRGRRGIMLGWRQRIRRVELGLEAERDFNVVSWVVAAVELISDYGGELNALMCGMKLFMFASSWLPD